MELRDIIIKIIKTYYPLKMSENSNIKYVSDKCIKQEYQKLFQKSQPVFPVLRSK